MILALQRFFPWVAMAGLIGCAAFGAAPAGVVGATLVPGELVVAAISGRLRLSHAEAAGRPLVVGATLRSGATLRTDLGSTARCLFADGAIVKMEADSAWRLDEFSVDPATPLPDLKTRAPSQALVNGPAGAELVISRTKIWLEAGEIEIQVPPLDLARGARFQVETTAGVVSVRGTMFRLRLRPSGESFDELSILVSEGMVVFFTKDGKQVEYVSPNRPFTVKIPR